MKQVAQIQPQTSNFRIEVRRFDQGQAQYIFYDGATVVYVAQGFWDDATPWESDTYVATRGKDRFSNPMWDFVDDPAGRSGVQLHQGASTAQSHGCLLAPGSFLKDVDAYIKATGLPNTITLDVKNDYEVKLKISTSVTQVEEGNVITVTVSLTGPGAVNGISKDIYVRVDLDKSSTATAADYEMFGDTLKKLWTSTNSAQGANFNTSALHLKIPAGESFATFQIKTKADDDKIAEAAIFKIGDYAIFWKFDPKGNGLLYSDSKSPKLLIDPTSKATVTITPAGSPDDGMLHLEGSTGRYERTIQVTPGKSYQYAFEAYTIPDNVTISDNIRTYVSTGLVSGFHSDDFVIDPKSTGRLTVVVTGNQNSGTLWVLDVGPTNPGGSQAPNAQLAAAAAPASITPGADIVFDLVAGQSASLSASLTAGKTYVIVVVPAEGTEIDPNIVVTNGIASETMQFGDVFASGNAAGVILADRSETVTFQVSGGSGEVRLIFKEVQPADLNVFALEMGQRLLPEMAEPDGGTTGFTVLRLGDVSASGSVAWRLVPSGTNPVNAADFGGQLPSGTLAFTAGQVQAFVSLNIPVDALSEAPEGFRIELFNPVGSGLATVATNGIGTSAEGAALDGFFAPYNYGGTIDNDTAYGGPPDDHLEGQNGNDALNGMAGNDRLEGDAGDDVLEGGEGDDILDGGSESDTASYAGAATGVSVDLSVGLRQNTSGAGFDTLTGIENLLGSDWADALYGNAAANLLDGGGDADMMAGGAGDDIYVVDDFLDDIEEAANAGFDSVRSSVSYALAENVEALLLTGASAIDGAGNALANRLTGNGAANRLSGGSGNDLLDGGAGADVLIGGLGDDGFTVDNPGDSVRELPGGGTDGVTSSVSFALPADVENLALVGSAASAVGNALANRLTGNDSANLLDGGAGADTMAGGLGDDTYVIDNAGDQVSEAGGGGVDRVLSSVTHTLGADFEQLTLTGSSAISGFGNGLANRIVGNGAANRLEGQGGDDLIDGGAGADRMTGGAGDDLYVVDNSGDVVSEAAGGGYDVVQSSVSYVLPAEVDALVLTGIGAINGTGNALANALTGNAAANRLDGGGGADRMTGGFGNDLYFVDSPGDVVDEAFGGGIDEVRTALATYVLGANLEYLAGTSTAGQVLTGNGLANIIAGGSGNDRIDGGLGADRMLGGPGNDLYIVDAGDVVVEAAAAGTDEVRTALASYALTANVEKLVGTSAAGQALTGNAQANSLTGGVGNDVLNGGAGADAMIGGLGNDVYFVDHGSDVVAESGGLDEIRTTLADTTASAGVETLTGLANSGQVLRGNTLNNIISGGTGADTMRGGIGNDIYLVGAGDVVVENGGEGSDEVRTELASYALGANLEKLTGGAAAQALTGNDLDNVIAGGLGADVLKGAGGNDLFLYRSAAEAAGDKVDGGAGADVLSLDGAMSSGVAFGNGALASVEKILLVSAAAGRFNGYNLSFGGNNVAAGQILTIDGSALRSGEGLSVNAVNETLGALVLLGGASRDVLSGGSQADTLRGGLGGDHLRGNGGADRFVYGAAADSTSTGFDQLVGFDYRVDRIDLPTAVSAWTGDIATGALRAASFDADLGAAVNAALQANSAVLFRPDSGDMAGRTFAVIDANGDGNYQAGQDYVFEFVAPAVPIAPVTGFFV